MEVNEKDLQEFNQWKAESLASQVRCGLTKALVESGANIWELNVAQIRTLLQEAVCNLNELSRRQERLGPPPADEAARREKDHQEKVNQIRARHAFCQMRGKLL